jgi:hypothetical protein
VKTATPLQRVQREVALICTNRGAILLMQRNVDGPRTPLADGSPDREIDLVDIPEASVSKSMVIMREPYEMLTRPFKSLVRALATSLPSWKLWNCWDTSFPSRKRTGLTIFPMPPFTQQRG